MKTPVEKWFEFWANVLGKTLVSMFHHIALFAIGAVTVWSGTLALLSMLETGRAGLEDLLLLFIYLEIGAMVGIYFKTNRMPVRFLIYVAITAVTRLIIDLVNVKHESSAQVLILGITILILVIADFVVRYSSYRYPSQTSLKVD
jgi:protein PsiE